jgi:hypothetical protein
VDQDGPMKDYLSKEKKKVVRYNNLGQDQMSDDLDIDRDELEWAYEQGALNTEEALTMISNHKRSVMR